MAQAMIRNIGTTEKAEIIGFPQIEQPKEVRQNNKKKGQKSEVFAFEIEDVKKITEYFKTNNMDIHNLIFVTGLMMARRIGDTLNLRWENFYNPRTGNFREHLEIVEEKTGKIAYIKINDEVKKAVAEYVEKYGVDVSRKNYTEPVFMQLTGTHQGKVITPDGYRKALKKAAVAVGIEYNVGTHSTRKTFGKLSRMLHPNDYDSMNILQGVYNHSSQQTTQRYIGLTQEKTDAYMDDMGEMFNKYITGDEKFTQDNKTVVSIDINDLREMMALAFSEGGRVAAGNFDEKMDAMNALYGMLDELVK